MTIQFARVAPWSVPAAAIATLALGALLLEVDVLWVVLGGVSLSALLRRRTRFIPRESWAPPVTRARLPP